MSEDNSKITQNAPKTILDDDLKNVTGGTGTAIDDAGRDGSGRERKNTGKDAGKNGGGICPLNGKYCKHGDISCLDGSCHNARERKENTKNGYFTVLICEYINDQV